MPRRGESGATLIIALVAMVAMGILVASVITYASTSASSVRNYRIVRTQRYIGDAAMKEAINWVSTKDNVGRDPNLGLGDKPCISLQNQVIDGVSRKIKVSCAATPGGGSGAPTEVGLATPEALVLLSNRATEPGPYVARPCQGWWETFLGFFTENNTATVDASKGLIPEIGAWFRATQGLGLLNATCTTVGRATGPFRVQGDLVAKSSLRVEAGSVSPSTNGGRPYAGRPSGCIGITCTDVAGVNRSGFTGALTYLNGTNKSTDPGRSNPSSPSVNPVGDLATPFLPVNFNADGTPITVDNPCTTASHFCERNTAYVWNSSTNVFTAVNSCPGTSPTIVFLPGWYRDAEILNRYTTNGSCKDVTFWFAPDPGADGILLTSDDKTGAFYMDFRQGGTYSCRGSAAQRSQWCVGGTTDQNARIVTGTPLNWSPQGSFINGGGSAPNRIAVAIDTANTVDRDLSGSWYDHNGNRNTSTVSSDARKIDGTAARYHPDNWGIGCIIFCFSTDRAIRLRDFSPDAIGPPIDEGAVAGDATAAPRGRIYLTVAYSVSNSNRANAAEAVIEAVAPDSGRHSCGTYQLINNPKTNADASSGLHTYTFTPVQARQLAAACGSVELINGLEIKLQVTGNTTNSPATTDWYLDGARINYDTFPSAQFPAPTNPNGTGSTDAAAKSDCDATKAGGQLIFGGDSHVYMADGSLEVCAGPYPVATGDGVDNHVNIGIWQMAAVNEIGPTGSGVTCINDCTGTSFPAGGNMASAIAQIDSVPVQINYPGRCPNLPWTGTKTCDLDGTLNVPMNGYSAPSGYKIQKVTARIGYNPKNFCFGFLGCPGNAPRLSTPSCSNQDYPKHSNQRMQIAAGGIVTMYDDGSTGGGVKNCLNVPSGGGSIPAHNIQWHARALGICVIYICGGSNSDEFDGILYQVHLVPTSDTAPRIIPASGCLLVHPNYNSGSGQPDCALVKATALQASDSFSFPWSTLEGTWKGRLSVKGAIYTPSAPIEVDDTDVAYALATRGAVMRHLRVTGFAFRNRYSGVAVDTTVDRTPKPREATFVTCIVKVSTDTQPCGTGDQILARARVLFKIDPTEPVPEYRAKIPDVQWWTEDR